MTNLLLHHLIFSLLLLPLFMVDAQTKGNISIGSYLTAGNSNELWVSPSEDFAFGFHQLADDSFIPAIWYYKLSGQITTVWYANEGKPAPRNSTLELTANGLVLRNGAQQLWSSRKTSSAEVTYAVMNDTGNFVLMNWNSKPIWESFHNPTDTLLPSQIMELGGFLSSRTSNNDFSPRRFQFRFEDGVASLVNINLPGNFIYSTYYTTETVDASNSSYQVVFDVLGLYGLGRNGSNFFIIKSEDPDSTSSDLYKRVSLNFDGTLTLSSHPKDPSAGNETWRTIRSIPDNICLAVNGEVGSGVCGFNSICSMQSDGRPNCICPDGYSLFNTSDQYGGCRPNFLLGCDNSSGQIQLENHFMESIPGVNFPYSDYAVLSNISEKDCQNDCKHDCLCAAVIFDLNSMRCWKKRPPLSNGRYEVRATVAYLKTANNSSPQIPPSPSQVPEKDQNIVAVVVLSVLLGSSVLVNFVFVGAICMGIFVFFKRKLLGLQISPNESSVESRLQQFTYKELTEATNGFKEELGRGSCGIVYKGKTRSTGLIAVKMLDRVFEDIDREFKTEVNIIGQTHHKNLLRLVGYCDEKQHRLLVYEFLKNGTLARFLYGDLKPSWKQRTQIALGIARGLVYLHEECSKQIIHRDIKPQNILLDEYYNARISDFGLAKLLFINQSYTKTNIRGTKGYVAPDWFRSAPVSVKVDVYSFGVVLLEIICCRRNVLNMEVDEVHKRILTDYAYDCYMEGKLDALIENDMEAMEDIKMVERFVMVAIWCIQEDPNKRPTMKKVMLMLEGILQVSVPPTPFSFTSIEIVH